MSEVKIEVVGVKDALVWAEELGFSRAVDWLNALGYNEAAEALAEEWGRRNPPSVMVTR